MKTLIALLMLATPALADTAQFDAQMQPALGEYLKVHAALAGDTTTGVADAAKALSAALAKVDAKTVTGEHASHYAELPAKAAAAAMALAEAQDLAAAREAFKALSRPMAMWVTMSKPKGVSVVYCSMAKGSWLQAFDGPPAVKNPYYGAQMLTCGEVIEGQAKGAASGHMKKGG